MRQIVINEPDINLRYVYFLVYLIDGIILAETQDGNYPEVNINNNGWTQEFIGPLEYMGYGNYRALLTSDAVSNIGIILSHYLSPNTRDSFGEPIQIVEQLTTVNVFENEGQWNNKNIINKSYVTVSEAESYFSTVLGADAWEGASQKNKLKALMEATRDIDRLNFKGSKLDPNQPLEFPRKTNRYPRQRFDIILGPDVHRITANDPYSNVSRWEENLNENLNQDSIIPDDIKTAACLIALKHLEGVDIEEEMGNLTIESQRFTGLHETYSRISTIEAYRAGINSLKAWTYLKPYLEDPRRLRLTRV
jgi:hypothetical protein